MGYQLDDIDKGILYLLQRDARNTTAQDIADTVGVSPSTVRNRIENLEQVGVIRGYIPKIDYEAANFPLQAMFVITAPATEKTATMESILEIRGITEVTVMLTGHRNLHVTAVGTDTSDIARITDAIHDLGVTIESTEMIRNSNVQPFDHFHYSGTTQESSSRES